MSRQFSILTKLVAFVLVLFTLASFVSPVLASDSDCDDLKDKAWAASAEVAGKCTTSVLACGAAIAAGNFWGLAGCAWAFVYLCQPAQIKAADAWAAYWDCKYQTASYGSGSTLLSG